MSTFETVANVFAEYKDVDVATILPDATYADLGLDSLDTVEIVMKLEDAFDVEIEMDASLKTVNDLVALIEAKKA